MQPVAQQTAGSVLHLRQRAERELIHAQEALRRSNDRVTAILESVADGFVAVDAAWRFTYVNRKAEEILRPLGKTREDLIGRNLWDEFPILLGSDLGAAYREAAQIQGTVEMEVFFPPLASWFVVRIFPSADGLTIYFQDVTRRKLAEVRLAAERGVLELIATGAALPEVLDRVCHEAERQSVDGMLCSVLLADERGTHLVHGAAPSLPGSFSARMDGLPVAEGAGSCGTAAFRGEAVVVTDIEQDPLWASWRGLAAEHGLRACCAIPLLSSQRAVLGTLAMYYGERREPSARDRQIVAQAARLLGIAIEKARAEQGLRDETRTLELLNRTGTSLAANLDLASLVQTITDAATQLSGARFGAFFQNVEDGQGGSFMLYTLSGAPREAFERFGHPRATPLFGPTFRGEGVIRCDDVTRDPRYGVVPPHHGMPSGHLPVRSYLAVPVRSRSGGVIGGLFFGHPEPGIFTERTERLVTGVAAQAGAAIDNARLYEAAQAAASERAALLDGERHARSVAERASRMKDEFLATLSHELRTPLSAILGWAHVLRRREAAPDELRRGLETIERNARIQTQLIEDLLDMSRITSGKVRLDVQPVLPAAVVEAALESVRPAAEARGIRLETMLDHAAGPVHGDPGRLQQVAWNLLSNAIKFTPRGGRVQVVVRRHDSHVEVEIADTGVGIDPELLDAVFERFRQAETTTTRRFGGLGLGLSIVKSLVELHGGTVRARSGGEGQGAAFSVLLPVAVVARRPDAGPRVADPGAPGLLPFAAVDLAGVTVLVVDDQEDGRVLVARVLAECHAAVLCAASAGEALALVEREKPDVLVTDIGMPDVDGYELLRRVRALGHARGGALPAVALTAFARSEDRTRALYAGFQVHLAKPVEPSELLATVASLAGRTGGG